MSKISSGIGPVIPPHLAVGVIPVRVLLYQEYGCRSAVALGRLDKPKLGQLLDLTVDNIPLHPKQTVSLAKHWFAVCQVQPHLVRGMPVQVMHPKSEVVGIV